MKRVSRVIALLLAMALIGTTVPAGALTASAAEISSETGNTDTVSENAAGAAAADGADEESADTTEQTTADTEEVAATGETTEEQSPESDAKVTSDGLINYVGVESPYVESPAAQKIVVSYGDGTENVSGATLRYQNSSGEVYEMELSKKEENLYLFEKEFTEADKGVYYITEFSYVQDGVSATVKLQDIGVEAVFGVDEYYPGYLDGNGETVDAETEESVVSVDAGDVETTEEAVATALEETDINVNGTAVMRQAAAAAVQTTDQNVVVVLDPGHGGSDGGASGNGVSEDSINYKIASYCKAELEQYSGVTVYMTRDENTCPTIYERVQIAANYGADILVSLHNNSADSSAAYGVEVYYPNSNYNAEIGAQGKELAQSIQDELVALGLYDRGIKIRSTVNDTYSDGSKQDYYGIIRYSKLAGFPGIIVEHAFVSNASDVKNYLSSDAKLKSLGVADATGIANYLGLSKGKSVSVTSKDDFAGTANIVVSGSGGAANVKVWNGSDTGSAKWYTLSGGSGTVAFKKSDFGNAAGTYHVEVYNADKSKKYSETSFQMLDTSVTLSAVSSDGEKTYTLKAVFAEMPDSVKAVRFPVWTASDQSDIRWISATQTSAGVWTASLSVSDYKKSGTYYFHAYATLSDGTLKGLAATTFAVQTPSVTAKIQNYQQAQGTFDVIVSVSNAPSGASTVRVPVWCAANQSDIRWYNAVKQSDGTYKVTVNMANHGYAVGAYKVHVYVTTGNGLTAFANAGTQQVSLPSVGISASDQNNTEMKYALKATNTGLIAGIKSVSFAVWSEKGGQDDLVWYGGTKGSSGVWTATADIAKNHKTAGTYQVHVYAIMTSGGMKFLGKTTFEVSKPSFKAAIQNYNQNQGTFDVIISGITSASGVSTVKVPVWSKSDQSNILWYTAAKQSDGTYKATVSIANHGYAVGNYTVHTYLTAGNGVVSAINVGTQKVSLPEMNFSATDKNGDESQYALKVTNTGLMAGIKSVYFAVWSEKGGQDDLVWYGGTKGSSGVWTATADIAKNHKTAGTYQVHVYAVMTSGGMKFLGKTTFEVSKPSFKAVIQNYNQDQGTFDVVISDVVPASGVSTLKVPVWSKSDQSNIVWYTAAKQSDGTYKVTVSIANHGYAVGTYNVHVYLTCKNGLTAFANAGTQSVSLPEMKVSAADRNGDESQYALKITNTGLIAGIKSVSFAVWSETGGQDDLVWYGGTKGSSGVWTATADIAKNHKTAGTYQVHVYAVMTSGGMKFLGKTTFEVQNPALSGALTVENYDDTDGSFDIVIPGFESKSPIVKALVSVWCAEDKSDRYVYTAKKQSDGAYLVHVDPKNHGYDTGLYQAEVSVTTENGITASVGTVSQQVAVSEYYTIMGNTTVTVDQMVNYYKASGNTYPATALGKGGAATLEAFCQMYYDEAAAEGVRAEVAFAQAMHETGWLKYGGIVKIEQYNFAGLEALDGNTTGQCASFANVRTGIRAQIQHLKAYGSTAALKNTCVDPRFSLVARGSAPYVEWLGQKENPLGKGWATAEGYGYAIVKMIKALKATD